MPARDWGSSASYSRVSEMSRSDSHQSLLTGEDRSRGMGPGSGAASRYGPSSSFATRTSVASSSVNLRGSDRSPPLSSGGVGAAGAGGMSGTASDQAFFPGNPNDWSKEDDDFLHNPDPKGDRMGSGHVFTARGIANVGCLAIMGAGVIALFAGYPIIAAFTAGSLNTNGAFNLGGINGTGQVPDIPGLPRMIDPDTPDNARTRTGFDGNDDWELVFSDEFNEDGRTFYDGDDPFWQGVDLHYWGTVDFEYYHPSAATTRDGNLVITISQENIGGLNFKSAMLQSWNKLCFQYNFYIEVNVQYPGTPDITGFWPGVWTMGNLGRPGYGATNEGTWPYTYDSCDVGTLPNQTWTNGTGPLAALNTGNTPDGSLSYLPGQRLSACTCPGEDHPGPDVSKGRAAPEVDIIEAQIDVGRPTWTGIVSQSLQLAPFDDYYLIPDNSTASVTIGDPRYTVANGWVGGEFQQAASHLTDIPRDSYRMTGGGYSIWGFELNADPENRDNGYITWVGDGREAWTLRQSGVGPNPRVGLQNRIIPEEPMAMILNCGMSNNWQNVDFINLPMPDTFLIDYVRVYQRPGVGRIGCDPDDYPTKDYIDSHPDAYQNPNNTLWEDAGYSWPRNRLNGGC